MINSASRIARRDSSSQLNLLTRDNFRHSSCNSRSYALLPHTPLGSLDAHTLKEVWMSAQFKYPEVSSKPLLWESPIPRDTNVFKQFRMRSFECTLPSVVGNSHRLDRRHLIGNEAMQKRRQMRTRRFGSVFANSAFNGQLVFRLLCRDCGKTKGRCHDPALVCTGAVDPPIASSTGTGAFTSSG
jgi:hypothetical protein